MEGQRILLVSAGMGAGHDQSAAELARRFRARGAQARVVDLLALLPLGAGRALRWFYGALLQRAPWLYTVVYRMFMAESPLPESPPRLNPPRRALTNPRRGSRVGRARPLARLGAGALAPVVREFRPTAVVSTFHVAGQSVGELRRRGGLAEAAGPVPTIVVITEMVAHDLWLSADADLYCCLSGEIAEHVRAATGADAVGPGPLVDDRFLRAAADADLDTAAIGTGRRTGSTVLVSTGSWGVGDILDTVTVLAGMPDTRPIALCGRNDALRHRVSAIAGATALGWRDDMPDLLAHADVVVDNAGGSMCMEAFAAGTPVVEYRPIPGHGGPVAQALSDAGLVTAAADAAALVRAVDALRKDGPMRDAQIQRGHALFDKDPADAIARWLADHRPRGGGPEPPRTATP